MMTRIAKTAAVTLALIAATGAITAQAAMLIAHYDVNDPASWTGSQLDDLTGNYGGYQPSAGTNSNATYGAPVYVSNGAGPQDRAYLDFQLHGILNALGGTAGSWQLNSPTTPKVQGYTMEALFYVSSTANGFSVIENTGLGFAQQTGAENQFIYLPRGTNPSPQTNTQVDNAADDPQSTENVNVNLNGTVPLDQWFHFVKVHDADADEVRIYLDGVLQAGLTSPLDTDSSAVEYHWNGDHYGGVGLAGREIKGVGYSMTRIYRGALTPEEIQANFDQIMFIPEPTTFVVLALGALLAMARGRSRKGRNPAALALILTVALIMTGLTSQAVDYTWNIGGGGSWNTTAN